MFGLDARAARIAWTVALVAIALWVVYLIRKTLFLFVLALFVAYMMAPLVRWLDRHRPRRSPHAASVVVAFAIVLLALITVIAAVGPVIAAQSAQLSEELPKLLQRVQSGALPLPGALEPWRERVTALFYQALEGASRSAVPFAQQVVKTAAGIASSAVFLILIPILAFLFLLDSERIRAAILQWFGRVTDVKLLERVLGQLHETLGHYVRALGLLALATLVVYATFFAIVSMPYGWLLAALAAVLEFIPVIGPLTAAAVAVLVGVVTGYEHVLWLVAFFLAYRVFQDYILSPRLMGGGVNVHPVLIIFGFLAGEELGGIPGMFLSVPAIALLVILLRTAIFDDPRAGAPRQRR